MPETGPPVERGRGLLCTRFLFIKNKKTSTPKSLENSFTYCRKSGFGYTKCHAITQYPDPYYPLGIE